MCCSLPSGAMCGRRAALGYSRRAVSLAILVTIQAALGISNVLAAVPLWLALVHQFGAIAVLAHAVTNLRAMLPAGEGVSAARAAKA